jgi:hypothetical protein
VESDRRLALVSVLLIFQWRLPNDRPRVSRATARALRRLHIIRWVAAAGDGKQRRSHRKHAEADHICMNPKAANPSQILIHLSKMLRLSQFGGYQSEIDDNECETGECGK